jgi:hypothetical protein
MLRDFKNKASTRVVLDFKGVQNSRQVVLFKLNIDDSTNNGTVKNKIKCE